MIQAGAAVHGCEKVPPPVPPSPWVGGWIQDSIVMVAFWASIPIHEFSPVLTSVAWPYSAAAATDASGSSPSSTSPAAA